MMFIDGFAFFLVAALAFIAAIVILVTFHEFGHFWVARKLGVKVLRFSIGFGKPFWRRTVGKDPVEFVLAPIPLGGYVKMLDERDPTVTVAPEERSRAFNRAAVWKRVAILLAGPAFNFIFAVLAFWMIFLAGVTDVKVIVGQVSADSPAAAAGMRPGDEILQVGDTIVEDWDDALLGILDQLLEEDRIPVTLSGEDGETRAVHLDVRGRQTELTEPDALLPGLGFYPWRPSAAILGAVEDGSPASKAGLREGDLIVSTDGEAISDWAAFVAAVQNRPETPMDFVVKRDGSSVELTVVPERIERDGEQIGRIGVGQSQRISVEKYYPEMQVERRYGPLEALAKGGAETLSMSVFTVRMLGKMITGEVSRKNISGPINIAEIAAITAVSGVMPFLKFLAIVSISLGILNLLPIPMLDGGQIVYQVAELVKGSPVSERAQLFGQQIGIALLFLLISFAFYNDITRHLN